MTRLLPRREAQRKGWSAKPRKPLTGKKPATGRVTYPRGFRAALAVLTVVFVFVFVSVGCGGETSLSQVEARARSSASTQPTTPPAPVAATATATAVPVAATPTPVFEPMDAGDGIPTATPVPPGESPARDTDSAGSSWSTAPLLEFVGNIKIEGLVIRIGSVEYQQNIVFRDGEDSNDQFLQVDVAFDQLHTLEPWDFRLTDNRGNEYRTSAADPVPQVEGLLRFVVDREIRTTSGWTLRVTTSGDSVEVAL